MAGIRQKTLSLKWAIVGAFVCVLAALLMFSGELKLSFLFFGGLAGLGVLVFYFAGQGRRFLSRQRRRRRHKRRRSTRTETGSPEQLLRKQPVATLQEAQERISAQERLRREKLKPVDDRPRPPVGTD